MTLSLEDCARYEATLRRILESSGVPITDRGRIVEPFKVEGKDRARAWLVESLIMAFQEWAAGDRRCAVRCALHAREMLGKMGGMYEGLSYASDAAIALQNAIEDAVTPKPKLDWPCPTCGGEGGATATS